MFCRKCGAPVPENALKCNNCFKSTGFLLRAGKFPNADMYGQRIYEVLPDPNKHAVRCSYIERLPEYHQGNSIKKEAAGSIAKYILLMILSIFGGVGICILSVFIAMINIAIGIFLFILSFALCITLAIVFYTKTTKNAKTKIPNFKKFEIHNNKTKYYANNLVFGYTAFNHSQTSENHYWSTDFYGFYEVDKRNIKGISYDSYFAEYILHLHKPVYIDYNLNPSFEFRIPDVFDDVTLSTVLSCDLPPKNIPY